MQRRDIVVLWELYDVIVFYFLQHGSQWCVEVFTLTPYSYDVNTRVVSILSSLSFTAYFPKYLTIFLKFKLCKHISITSGAPFTTHYPFIYHLQTTSINSEIAACTASQTTGVRTESFQPETEPIELCQALSVSIIHLWWEGRAHLLDCCLTFCWWKLTKWCKK